MFVALQVLKALISAKEKQDIKGWQRFQSEVHTLKLRRNRVEREIEEVQIAIEQVRSAEA